MHELAILYFNAYTHLDVIARVKVAQNWSA